MVSYYKNWVEIWFFIVLIIGFVLSIIVKSAVITYLIIFIVGMMAGRIMYWRHHMLKAGYYIIIIGFLVGYIIASILKPNLTYGSVQVMLILFALGWLLSYYLHEKKIIHTIQY